MFFFLCSLCSVWLLLVGGCYKRRERTKPKLDIPVPTKTADCSPGYRRDGRTIYCKDVNECNQLVPACDAQHTCENTLGSYVCHCARGYKQAANSNTACEDIDECESASTCKWGTSFKCDNFPGTHSYRCYCYSSIVCLRTTDYLYLETMCRSGWFQRFSTKTCIRPFEDQALSWSEARNFCRRRMGDLVKIGDADTNNFLYDIMGGNISYWIGLQNLRNDVHYRWLDECKRADFYDWAPYKPRRSASGPRKCTEISEEPWHGWKNTDCETRRPFICETPMVDQIRTTRVRFYYYSHFGEVEHTNKDDSCKV